MAAKNSIVHRVSLEGDADVKARLRSIEDAIKRLDVPDRSSGTGGALDGALKRAVDNAGKLREELSPVIGDLGGLGGGGAGGGLGAALGGLGGIVSKLMSGLSSPAGIVSSIIAATAKLVQVGDDLKRAPSRIKALGGGDEGVAALRDSAGRLGASSAKLQPGLENYLRNERATRRDTRIVGGPGPNGELEYKPNTEQFLAAQRTLLLGTREDHTPQDEAQAAVDAFTNSINETGGLTADAVRQLEQTSPATANRVARLMGPLVHRDFADAGRLSRYLDIEAADNPDEAPIDRRLVYRALAGGEEGARKAARAASGADDVFGSNNPFVGATSSYRAPGEEPLPPVVAPPPPQPGGIWVADPNAPGGMRRTTIPSAVGSEMPGPPPEPEIVPPQQLEQRSDASDSATQSLAALDGTAAKTSASLDTFATQLASILDRLAGGAAPTKAAQGGLITGPGTGTSDSIPAMLSDKEYVMPADATRAIGTNILDTLRLPAQRGGLLSRMRRAARRFADGGVVSWRDEEFWKKHKKEIYFDDPAMEEQRNSYLFHHPMGDFEKKTFADLGPGDHSIAYDPNSGGAIIDGINYGPEDPLLQDPIIKRELDASAASMGQDSASKSKFKSQFVGKFGGHVFGESGSYADGGLISGPGTGTSDSIPILVSNGEHITNERQTRRHRPLLKAINEGNDTAIKRWMIEKFGTTMVSAPGFANGGIVGDIGSLGGSAVPDLPDFGAQAAAEALHPVTIAMPDGREVGGLRAPRDVVRALEREARDESFTRTGRMPSWYR